MKDHPQSIRADRHASMARELPPAGCEIMSRAQRHAQLFARRWRAERKSPISTKAS